MPLIRFQDVSLSLTELPVLDQVTFDINAGDRIAIIGRNGTGKSTLLKLIAGSIQADDGEIKRATAHINTLIQSPPRDLAGTIGDYLTQQLAHLEDWEAESRIQRALSEFNLTADMSFSALSGGQGRRALLCGALISEPDLLLLDEPTNHLDMHHIQWLESELAHSQRSVVLVTHDRAFLQQTANRIIELDRGKIIDWQGDYHGFLKHKAHLENAEALRHEHENRVLAKEEAWIRQGIKARRTRNEGRVRALVKMRQAHAQRRVKQGKITLKQQTIERTGKDVFIAEHINKSYNDQTLINDFSCVIQQGEKVGIVGPNGCGKSTLIRCLLGDLQPDSGQVKQGTRLQVAYFDQHREALDESGTLIDAVGQGRQSITINDKEKHIISYLSDFLFSPDQARGPVSKLSGGEKNRLLLAKLFSTPANVLVLDEPTNDLDIESLELLEEYLADFTGTVLLITHDRALLNHVVTTTLVFEPSTIRHTIGGWEDYVREQQASLRPSPSQHDAAPQTNEVSFSNADRRELSKLPGKIEQLEARINQLHTQMSEPEFLSQSPDSMQTTQAKLTELDTQLAELYDRWECLSLREQTYLKQK